MLKTPKYWFVPGVGQTMTQKKANKLNRAESDIDDQRRRRLYDQKRKKDTINWSDVG